MSLRIKLIVFSIILTLIPLGIAGMTMIRITRDELKSSANDNLIAVANQVTQEVENFYRYDWLAPLRLIKKVLENKNLKGKEKLSLLTEEMKSATDLVAIQISVQGASSPLLVTQDDFLNRLTKSSLEPSQILELPADRIRAMQKHDDDIFTGDLVYIPKVDTWLITVNFSLDEAAFDRPATLSARINLSRLLNRVKANSFNKIGAITLIDIEGRNLFDRGRPDISQGKLVETAKNLLNTDIRTMGTEFSILPSGEKMLGAYAIPGNPRLGVIVEMKESKAYLAVTKMEKNFITWMIFGFSIAVAGAVVVSVSLTKPLRWLTQAARTISKGDFSGASDIKIRSKDEVGVLASAFVEMSRELEDSYKQLAEYNKNLEQKVEERSKALKEAHEDVMQSIRYAKMIQRSLLPNLDEVKAYLPDSFFIWIPRDIVGGDAYFVDFFEGGFVIAVIDCTGHGVPGAFMTMIASSALQRVIRDEVCHDPGEILNRLNFIVKTSLQQHTEHALSDDGLDAAICFVSVRDTYYVSFDLTFAGAKMPLIYVHEGELSIIKGDRQSIGYRKSNLDFEFTNHKISVEKGMSFYIYSDGVTDQLDESESHRFGSRRLKELLKKNAHLPFKDQRKIISRTLDEYKGGGDMQDDVTIVGFGF
ncbi:SpoIIE family protein phosphatase [Desulfococcaceae bacterium HSG8]|nr:SpoIIE family protein phosphatase [Desulfococcaceae bacterium HSG8]